MSPVTVQVVERTMDGSCPVLYEVHHERDGRSWTVQRRYSALHAMKEALRAKNAKLPSIPFPPKRCNALLGPCSRGMVRHRGENLQLYLRALSELQESWGSSVVKSVLCCVEAGNAGRGAQQLKEAEGGHLEASAAVSHDVEPQKKPSHSIMGPVASFESPSETIADESSVPEMLAEDESKVTDMTRAPLEEAEVPLVGEIGVPPAEVVTAPSAPEAEAQPVGRVEAPPAEEIETFPGEEVEPPAQDAKAPPLGVVAPGAVETEAPLAEEIEEPPTEETEAPPAEETEAPPAERVEAPPAEETETPAEKVEATPAEVTGAPLAEEVEAPPIEQTEAPPAEEVETPPIEETEAQPAEETEAPPIEVTEAPPAEEVEAPPIEESEAPPAEESEALPAEESEAPPAEESEALPAEESEAPPAEESEALPAEESETPPAEESETPPAEESETPPAEEAETPEDGMTDVANFSVVDTPKANETSGPNEGGDVIDPSPREIPLADENTNSPVPELPVTQGVLTEPTMVTPPSIGIGDARPEVLPTPAVKGTNNVWDVDDLVKLVPAPEKDEEGGGDESAPVVDLKLELPDSIMHPPTNGDSEKADGQGDAPEEPEAEAPVQSTTAENESTDVMPPASLATQATSAAESRMPEGVEAKSTSSLGETEQETEQAAPAKRKSLLRRAARSLKMTGEKSGAVPLNDLGSPSGGSSSTPRQSGSGRLTSLRNRARKISRRLSGGGGSGPLSAPSFQVRNKGFFSTTTSSADENGDTEAKDGRIAGSSSSASMIPLVDASAMGDDRFVAIGGQDSVAPVASPPSPGGIIEAGDS